MLLRGHAQTDADLSVGERMIDGADQVVHCSLVLAHEGGRHMLGAGGDLQRVGSDIQTRRLGLGHPSVDREQRYSFPVDRDLDLLVAVGPGEDLTLHRGIGHDVEHVLSVGREIVHHREAAARPERRVLDALPLGLHAGNPVDGIADFGVWIPERDTHDLSSRAQVALHDRRRWHLHVGDVVEIRALGIERQKAAHVHVESEHVANRTSVLGPVEPLERTCAWIRVPSGGTIDDGLQLGRDRLQHSLFGPLGTGGRHHTRAQLPNHLLDRRGILRGVREVEVLQDEFTALPALAVAAGAVLFYYRVRTLVAAGNRMSRGCEHRGLTRLSRTGAGGNGHAYAYDQWDRKRGFPHSWRS